MLFQHGEAPEHFLQTFHWARRAVELGAVDQMQLIAMGLDRYLMSKGRKQLFGTQFFKNNSQTCWCMWPVEESFESSERVRYLEKTLFELRSDVSKLNGPKNCPDLECNVPAEETREGSIPGFW